VVQSIDCCAKSIWEAADLQKTGNFIFVQRTAILLCFEHVCNRSFDKHISGMITKQFYALDFLLSLLLFPGVDIIRRTKFKPLSQ
jgi:hypothetical protein